VTSPRAPVAAPAPAPASAATGGPVAPRARRAWSRVWSTDAGLRALRATLVVPAVFAVADQVVGNLQMATFAAFGGFATLVMSGFGGTRRDKALAHLGLALTGTALVVIGTLVSSSALLASLVALPVTFLVLFAGATAPNAASGAMGALLAFVLPAVSAGTASMIPARLAGWWLASVAGTAAVLLLSPRPASDRLHAAGAALAGSLADELDAALRGAPDSGLRAASLARNQALRAAFGATPYRPTGLAAPDQAFANLVETLEWCFALVGDVVRVRPGLASGPDEERVLADESSRLLRAVAALLSGRDAVPDIEGVKQLVAAARQRAWNQAAFTVLVAVLFNLIDPVGWRVGVVRIEDVALGCAVSVLVGVLLWPRGVVAVVADDLADAFRQGSSYLTESMDWILGRSTARSAGGLATVSASIRLDGALRGLLAEQGTRNIPREHLWRLVGAAMRLRLTARTLARAQSTLPGYAEAKEALAEWTAGLVSWYDRLACTLAGDAADDRRTLEAALPEVSRLFDPASDAAIPARAMWIGEHPRGLRCHLADTIGPALELSAARRRPWWR
jgi:uncharacterized membrane protein YccC